MTLGTVGEAPSVVAMDDSNHGARPALEPREVPTAYCGVRACGMHPEHLYTDDAGRAIRCPGSQPA